MRNVATTLLIATILTGCAAKLTETERSRINQQLDEMVTIDQVAAYIPQGKYKEYSAKKWADFKDSVFTTNERTVERLFKKYGFLGFDKIGKKGSNHFWLLVQHFDKYPDFQKKVLKEMDRNVKKRNADPNNYAYLYDRVKVNAGEKQLFGTQVRYEAQTTGRAIPANGLADSVNVDKFRSEYGLGSLKDYLNQMTTMHFEMNKVYYEKMGVTKPNLYK